MTELLLIQLASYRPVPTREIEYQLDVLIDLIYYPIFLVLFFDTPTFFDAFYCIAPSAWIKALSFGACFKSVASFCHPQYLLRTSPRFIPCAWNSRFWHFHLNHTLFAPEKCLKSRFCDSEAWIDDIDMSISSVFSEEVQTRGVWGLDI